jgi:serine-type D-Ala-D-Ala carboxypeptidase (penicillin-binding protein 5/6)
LHICVSERKQVSDLRGFVSTAEMQICKLDSYFAKLPGRRGAWLLLSLLVAAQVSGAEAPPVGRIEAPAFIVVDHGSGRVLAERHATAAREPASLTKLMTAYVVFEELRKGTIELTDEVRVSHQAWRAPGSQTFLRERSMVPVSVLIQGMIVQSGNDAAIALAERIAGSERSFSDFMNVTAKRLGMASTHFVNATGLPRAGHVSSAHDLAILASAILREYPEYYGWYSQRSFEWNDIKQWNRNHLLGHLEGVDGMKTGFTVRAGYCIVASAKRDDMRVVVVVFGSRTAGERTRATRTLLDYAFANYETHRVYAANESVVRAEVAKGTHSSVALGLTEDLFLTVRRGESARLRSTAEVAEHLTAPLTVADPVGQVRISLDGETLATRPLHPLTPVERGRWWNRLMNGDDTPQNPANDPNGNRSNSPNDNLKADPK